MLCFPLLRVTWTAVDLNIKLRKIKNGGNLTLMVTRDH
jgi:hypothetical protein